jgi:hypothetical protein
MSALEQAVTRGRQAIGLAHTSYNKDKKQESLNELNDKLARAIAERDKAILFIGELTDVIEKYNMEHSGQPSVNLVPSDAPVDELGDYLSLVESDINDSAPVDAPGDTTTDYSVTIEGSNIWLGQYDRVATFALQNPLTKNLISINGIPAKQQRHRLGEIMATFVKSQDIKNDTSIKQLLVIRDVRTLQPVTGSKGHHRTVSCGLPYGSCKCNKNKNEPSPANDYLSSLENKVNGKQPPADSPLSSLQRFKTIHDPSKGSKIEWIDANKAIALCKQNGVAHKGYLDWDYRKILVTALTSDKINASDIRSG